MNPTVTGLLLGRWLRVAVVLALLAVVVPATRAPAHASDHSDMVVAWNQHASDALINPPNAAVPGFGQPPQVAVVHMGIVQGAVYDAVNSIDRTHEPYLDVPSAPVAASRAAAAATAAHHVLVGLTIQGERMLPEVVVQRLDERYAESLAVATAADGPTAVTDGVAAGQAAADAMLEAREDDGRYPAGTSAFPVGDAIGEWRPVEPGFVNDPNAWVADVTPLLVDSSSQFRTKGPRRLHTGAWAREYEEVRTLGGDGDTTPTARTPEQQAIADFYLFHPIEMFNRTFRDLAIREGVDLPGQARLFAMLNMTAADTQINCWDDKRFWSFWRPITAIRDGASDGNARTQADPGWTPMIATPPYPEHPSGFNCVTSAYMHQGAKYFGPRLDLQIVKPTPTGPVVREYDRFDDVLEDVVEARILQGVHFRSADEQAAKAGRDVTRWVNTRYFAPVHRKGACRRP